LEPYVNRELVFGGVVTDVQHRVSKQGKGWALFTIEDYTDSYEFRVFGEEYLKFRHFLLKNSFVFVKTFVREGWTNKDTGKKSDPRLQFNSFQLLHDVMEQYAKKLSIQVDIKDLNEQKIIALKELLNMYPGNQTLNFVVYDTKEKMKLAMPSRRQKVKVSQELLNELEAHDVRFKLN
jgi:DNA polymerase-3 subunit alpha